MKVLSIDGGGIRGLIPALVLAELERRAGDRRVADLFDLVAGTSTGGILALGLAAPGSDGTSRYTAAELVGLYDAEGPHIFSRSAWDRVHSAEGVLDEKYPAHGIDDALGHYFGDARLKDARTDVLVTAYETVRRQPFFFRSSRAAEDAAYDYPMRAVARATSAAPTYFEAAELVNDATHDRWSLVDGGVFANNPAMCAWADVSAAGVPREEITIVSLGTGEHTRKLPHDEIAGWGLLEWARPVLDVVFDGVSDAAHFQLGELLTPERYWRLQVELRHASDNLDDAGDVNRKRLHEEAKRLIDANDGALDAIVAAL